jgi:hypothetical protein
MKKIFLLFILLNTIIYASESIEVMRSLGENPPKKYSSKHQKNSSKNIVDGVKSKVHKAISSDRQAEIKSKLKVLRKKIASKSHTLKLKNRAKKRVLKKQKNSNKNKRLKKSKKMLKRLRGSIHTTN